MDALSYDGYEELLRKAGVRRSPGGSLVFEHHTAEGSEESYGMSVEGGVSDRSDRAFLPPRPPAPPPTRTGARPHYAEEAEEEEEEEEEGAAFAWEADLELVAGEVDFHANALKGAVLGRLLALKKKLTASAAALDSERRFISARAAALQHKADLLQETLFRERALSGSTRLRILSMFFGLRPGPDMKEAFQRWRAHLLEKKRRRASALAATAHSNRTLLLAVLRDWRSNARASFRERMHAELDARWAEGAQSEAAKFGVLLARLQSELEDARAALERETGARVEAEERFKQAFMRGVCALNFEALNVLKNGPLVDALKGRAPSSNTHA